MATLDDLTDQMGSEKFHAVGKLAGVSNSSDSLFANLQIINDPFVLEPGLGVVEVLIGGDHVTVKGWSEVIQGVLGFVVPFGLGFFGSELPMMVDHLGSESLVGQGVDHIGIWTKVWNWVVDFVTELWFLVLVLIASS